MEPTSPPAKRDSVATNASHSSTRVERGSIASLNANLTPATPEAPTFATPLTCEEALVGLMITDKQQMTAEPLDQERQAGEMAAENDNAGAASPPALTSDILATMEDASTPEATLRTTMLQNYIGTPASEGPVPIPKRRNKKSTDKVGKRRKRQLRLVTKNVEAALNGESSSQGPSTSQGPSSSQGQPSSQSSSSQPRPGNP